MREGFIFSASGKYFVEEANKAVYSLKKHCNHPVVLFTDKQNISKASKLFDDVKVIENPQFNFIDKIEPMIFHPFERNIFLDTDTYVLADISTLFPILEKYDFFASFAPGREQMMSTIPNYFPEFNTGVIGFKSHTETKKLLKSWLDIYQKQLRDLNPPHDQPSFREALYKSDCTVYCLPEAYNFRITNPNVVWSNESVKIIHGRHSNYEALGKELGSKKKMIRIFFPDLISSNSAIDFFNRERARYIFHVGHKFSIYLSKLLTRIFSVDKNQKKKGNG